MPLRYVLGAQKSGSTALWDLLTQDADVCGAKAVRPSWRKETHLLHWNSTTRLQFTSLYWKSRCVSGCFAEGTPSNIRSPTAPAILNRLLRADERPLVRFVVVVREPVARDISYFNHFHADKGSSPALAAWNGAVFEAYTRLGLNAWKQCLMGLDATQRPKVTNVTSHAAYLRCAASSHLACGMYVAQLQSWWLLFEREQMLTLSLDQIFQRPAVAQRRVYRHLGLRSRAGLTGAFPSQGNNFASRVVTIDCSTKRALAALYAHWNEELVEAVPSLKLETPHRWRLSGTAGHAAGKWDRVPCIEGLWPALLRNHSEAPLRARQIFSRHAPDGYCTGFTGREITS